MSFQKIIEAGYVPYVSTAPFLEASFDLDYLETIGVLDPNQGTKLRVVHTGEGSLDFHKAYLFANTLAFGNLETGLGMPDWVLTDFVLHQSAVVGFLAPKRICQPELLDKFEEHASQAGFDFNSLEYLPITGQICGLTADRETWFGCSLFSHQRFKPTKDGETIQINDGLSREINLACYTKALALKTYRAKRIMGLTQYDNRAVRIHGLFGRMYLHDAIVWTHSRPFRSFTYRMDVDFDVNTFYTFPDEPMSFKLYTGDIEKIKELEQRIRRGENFEIVSPYWVKEEASGNVYLPVAERND